MLRLVADNPDPHPSRRHPLTDAEYGELLHMRRLDETGGVFALDWHRYGELEARLLLWGHRMVKACEFEGLETLSVRHEP